MENTKKIRILEPFETEEMFSKLSKEHHKDGFWHATIFFSLGEYKCLDKRTLVQLARKEIGQVYYELGIHDETFDEFSDRIIREITSLKEVEC